MHTCSVPEWAGRFDLAHGMTKPTCGQFCGLVNPAYTESGMRNNFMGRVRHGSTELGVLKK